LEEVTEEGEGRRNPKEGFASMNKNGNLSYGVGIQMSKGDAVVIHQPPRKVGSRETKTAFKKGSENYDLTHG
jgi:hypothetical protein